MNNEKVTISISGPKQLTITHTTRTGRVATLLSESTGNVPDRWWLEPTMFQHIGTILKEIGCTEMQNAQAARALITMTNDTLDLAIS